jgi:hypothetical protein
MGKDAAAKLNALGFKVAGWSASPKSLPGVVCCSGAKRHAGRAATAD